MHDDNRIRQSINENFVLACLQEFGGESKGAIIATVKSSTISACSAGSMVSTGKFEELCLRFAEDFNHTLDDWNPDKTLDPNPMNQCIVQGGYYQVCLYKEGFEDKNTTIFVDATMDNEIVYKVYDKRFC